MKYFLILFSFSLILFSCSEEKTQEEENNLPEFCIGNYLYCGGECYPYHYYVENVGCFESENDNRLYTCYNECTDEGELIVYLSTQSGTSLGNNDHCGEVNYHCEDGETCICSKDDCECEI